MMISKTIITLSAFVVIACGRISTVFGGVQYPTSLAEIDFINSAIGPLPEDSSQDPIGSASESLRFHLERLRSVDGADKRSIELLVEYLRLTVISEENCNLQHADELVFLLHAHQHDPGSHSFKFVQEIATRQFKLCLPSWEQQFSAAIQSIDEIDRNKMERLLDQMMQIRFKNGQQPSRPYKAAQMRELIANPPASAILLFMVSLDPLERRIPVDENMKNLSFSWENFQRVYADFVLGMCSNVCDSLEFASKFFKPAFDFNLDPKRYANVNHQRDHWMANKMICCSIKQSHERMAQTGVDDFMKSTFDKLTIQEEIMIENDLGLDELIAFGHTLGQD